MPWLSFTHVGVRVLGHRVEGGSLEGDRLAVREGVEGCLSSRKSHAAFAFTAEASLGGQACQKTKQNKTKQKPQTENVNNRCSHCRSSQAAEKTMHRRTRRRMLKFVFFTLKIGMSLTAIEGNIVLLGM